MHTHTHKLIVKWNIFYGWNNFLHTHKFIIFMKNTDKWIYRNYILISLININLSCVFQKNILSTFEHIIDRRYLLPLFLVYTHERGSLCSVVTHVYVDCSYIYLANVEETCPVVCGLLLFRYNIVVLVPLPRCWTIIGQGSPISRSDSFMNHHSSITWILDEEESSFFGWPIIDKFIIYSLREENISIVKILAIIFNSV